MFSKISGSLRKIEFSYCSIATNSAVCLTIEGNLLKPGTFGRGFLESQSNFAALQFYEIFSDYSSVPVGKINVQEGKFLKKH